MEHKQGFQMRSVQIRPSQLPSQCNSLFIVKKEWINDGNQGDIHCPNKSCSIKLGQFNWNGITCSCSKQVTPAFQILLERVKLVNVGLRVEASRLSKQQIKGYRHFPESKVLKSPLNMFLPGTKVNNFIRK